MTIYAANLYSLDGYNRGIVMVGADSVPEAREQMDQFRIIDGELVQVGEVCHYPDVLKVEDTGTLDDGTVMLMARE